MKGVVPQLRARRRASVRPWNHRTKAEYIETFLVMADSLAKYADNPDARASALKALDHVDELRISPRCGWYPRRPRGWRP